MALAPCASCLPTGQDPAQTSGEAGSLSVVTGVSPAAIWRGGRPTRTPAALQTPCQAVNRLMQPDLIGACWLACNRTTALPGSPASIALCPGYSSINPFSGSPLFVSCLANRGPFYAAKLFLASGWDPWGRGEDPVCSHSWQHLHSDLEGGRSAVAQASATRQATGGGKQLSKGGVKLWLYARGTDIQPSCRGQVSSVCFAIFSW